MTKNPDDAADLPEGESGSEGAAHKLDEDAAWAAIVAHYGDRPDIEEGPADAEPQTPPAPDADARLRGLFQPSWDDPLQTEATWDDEGHFVPPDPPPFPALDPRRRAAWIGLFGSPLVMLFAVVLAWQLPDWLMAGLVLAFSGGFVYLVATMPNRRPDDGSGGDGAVV